MTAKTVWFDSFIAHVHLAGAYWNSYGRMKFDPRRLSLQCEPSVCS